MRGANEDSAQEFELAFFEEKIPNTPSNLRWKVVDPNTDEVILDWQVETPATTVRIVVPRSAHQITDNKRWAKRQLVVQTDYDTAIQFTDCKDYRVKNIRGHKV